MSTGTETGEGSGVQGAIDAAQAYIVPDAFTPGTSEQRARSFLEGLKNCNPEPMDRAFEVDQP